MLVRRANNPAHGLWTLPAGFVDAGEHPAAAIEREGLEETGLTIKTTGLIDVLSGQEHPRGAHIIIFYCAEIIAGELNPGDVTSIEFLSSIDQTCPLWHSRQLKKFCETIHPNSQQHCKLSQFSEIFNPDKLVVNLACC